jgi:hypothetical protein
MRKQWNAIVSRREFWYLLELKATQEAASHKKASGYSGATVFRVFLSRLRLFASISTCTST